MAHFKGNKRASEALCSFAHGWVIFKPWPGLTEWCNASWLQNEQGVRAHPGHSVTTASSSHCPLVGTMPKHASRTVEVSSAISTRPCQYLINIFCSLGPSLMYFPPKTTQLLSCLPPGMETPSPLTTASTSCLKPLHPQHTLRIYMTLKRQSEGNRLAFTFLKG